MKKFSLVEWCSLDDMVQFTNNQAAHNVKVFHFGCNDGYPSRFYTIEIPDRKICISIKYTLIPIRETNIAINDCYVLVGFNEWIISIDLCTKVAIEINSGGVCFYDFIVLNNDTVVAICEISILKINMSGIVIWNTLLDDIISYYEVIGTERLKISLMGDTKQYFYQLKDGKRIQ